MNTALRRTSTLLAPAPARAEEAHLSPGPALSTDPAPHSRTWRLLSIGVLALILAATWVGSVEPLGRDPVSGEVITGFHAQPHFIRTLLEPLIGPALQVGREPSLRQFCTLGALWVGALAIILTIAALKGSRACRRALILLIVLSTAWSSIVLLGIAIPDRFVAVNRRGIFVDWHLHGGDPRDGRISISHLERREAHRGVSWAVMTPHSAAAPGGSGIAHGVRGTEWSGSNLGEFRRLHILVLGSSDAVAAANRAKTEVEAIRAAKERGALVIVAHYWRTAFDGSPAPTIEDLVRAGADGFEVGNRHREDNEGELGHQLDLDRRVASLGLLRFSFSDDHGYPAGSPCVTFLENVPLEDLDRDGLSIVSSLRRDSPGKEGIVPARVIPLLFDHAAPGRSVPAPFIPPVVLVDYLRGLTPPARLSWLVYGALAIAWMMVPLKGRRTSTIDPIQPGAGRCRTSDSRAAADDLTRSQGPHPSD